MRVSKINYYLDIAEAVLERSTCCRKKHGCIIVKNDEIIATGYSGAPRGRENCIDLGYCVKKKTFPDLRHGGYDACRSVHAEMNAMLCASRKYMIGSSLYMTCKRTESGEYDEGTVPCQMCRKLIINAGISNVYVRVDKENYNIIDVNEWVKKDDLLDGKITY